MEAVIITGSSGGIGKALVSEFKAAGYFTVGIDRVMSCHADANIECDLHQIVQNEEAANGFLAEIEQSLGGKSLKALVNNAALQKLGSIEQATVADFQETMDINLTVPFFLSKMVFEHLKDARGSIINIGSIHAKLTKPGFIAYATSKAALLGLTQAMAVDFGKDVRVNIIQPAAVSTDMLVNGFKENPEGLKQLESYHPSDCIGSPDEVAKLAIFLASEECHFINGATLDINGAIGARLHDPE